MPIHKADKSKGEEHDIPDDEVVVNQRNVGGVEVLETEKEEQGYKCHVCDEVFDSAQAMAGHMSSH